MTPAIPWTWGFRIPFTVTFINVRAVRTERPPAHVLSMTIGVTWRADGETLTYTCGGSLTWFGETKVIPE